MAKRPLHRYKKNIRLELKPAVDAPRSLGGGSNIVAGRDTIYIAERVGNATKRIFCLGVDSLGDPDAPIGAVE